MSVILACLHEVVLSSGFLAAVLLICWVINGCVAEHLLNGVIVL